MTAAEQDWVQQSLARLEQLEQQRVELEASGHTDKLAEVDEEIASLYEVLESVADDSEGAANPAVAAVPAAAVAVPAPAPAIDNPFGPPPAAAPAGPGVAAPAAAMAAPAAAIAAPQPDYSAYDDDFDAPKSKTGLIVGIVAVLAVGGGAVAFFAMQGAQNEEKAEPAKKEPGKVLEAGEIPDDTSEPKVAEGADADRSRGTRFKEGSGSSAPAARSRDGNRGGKRGGRGKRAKNNKKGNDRAIKVGSSNNDPLAGVD